MNKDVDSNLATQEFPSPLRFVERLRTDVWNFLRSVNLYSREDFLVWWVLHGRHKYPAWKELSDDIREVLFEENSNLPSDGELGASRVLCYLHTTSTDVRSKFDISTARGLAAANQWLFTHGLRCYHSVDCVDARMRSALNHPSPAGGNTPEPSLLIKYIWGLSDEFLANFPPTQDGQVGLTAWCFAAGFVELGLQDVVDDKWRSWALEPIRGPGSSQIMIPRIGYFLWKFRPGIAQGFDLGFEDDLRDLAEWTSNALTCDESLRWLKYVQPTGTPDNGREERTAPRPISTAEIRFGVNLIGYAMGELGVGEDVRMAALACEHASIPFAVLNVPLETGVRQNDPRLHHRISEGARKLPYPINIFCLPGFDTAQVYLKEGLDLFGGRYNIGWWPWELPVWPKNWQDCFGLVDEVWAATEFTRELYAPLTFKPVVKMPLPVSIAGSRKINRADFGIPENVTAFLFIFDANSYLARKNPFAAVEAFQSAFAATDETVCLVLKTMNARLENRTWRSLRRVCARDRRIILLPDVIDRGDILGLIEACNAYLSLHRSEGFGRTLAEAMLFGKPVIGTDYSGNTDFLNEETGFPVRWQAVGVRDGEYPYISAEDQAWWAEPDVQHAAEQMRKAKLLASDDAFSSKVRSSAAAQFSPSRIGGLMRQRLEACMDRVGIRTSSTLN